MPTMLGSSLLLLPFFCAYGAIASLEPSATAPIHVGWLIGYVVAGLASLTGSALLFRTAKRPPATGS